MANKLQADEISSIIKDRIENFEIGVDINEVGKVVGVADGITSCLLYTSPSPRD